MTQKRTLKPEQNLPPLGVTSILKCPIQITISLENLDYKLNIAKNRAWTTMPSTLGPLRPTSMNWRNLKILQVVAASKFLWEFTGSLLIDDEAELEKVFRSGHRRIAIHSEDEFRLKERKHLVINSKDIQSSSDLERWGNRPSLHNKTHLLGQENQSPSSYPSCFYGRGNVLDKDRKNDW